MQINNLLYLLITHFILYMLHYKSFPYHKNTAGYAVFLVQSDNTLYYIFLKESILFTQILITNMKIQSNHR